ncbi:hypothetical protein RhiirB3_474271 [Rhizophagus irregularis]|nr:hypothetical protein RhiirB3_474271 [Rhizophagus irregularis]
MHEERRLVILVNQFGAVGSWQQISSLLGSRNAHQCRKRYRHLVRANTIRRPFPPIPQKYETSFSPVTQYYEIINQDSGSARRIRRRVNQRVSQGLRPIALERLLHGILLAQQNNTISRDPRMDLSHILNTSRDLSTSNSSHDSRDPRMNLSHVLNIFRDSRMNLNHILNSSQDPRMNLNFILNNSLNHG